MGTLSRLSWNLEMLVFEDKRGKPAGKLGEKSLGARRRTNNNKPKTRKIGGLVMLFCRKFNSNNYLNLTGRGYAGEKAKSWTLVFT